MLCLLFAQQAAHLHALSHLQDNLASTQKGKPASHPVEHCIAFHALDSASTPTCLVFDELTATFQRLQAETNSIVTTAFQDLHARGPPARLLGIAV